MTHGPLARPVPLFRYAVAVVAASVATALKVALAAYVVPTYILAYPAVMLTAVVGGMGPGVLATILSAAMAWYWLLPPDGGFHLPSVQEATGLTLFVVMGLAMSLMADLLRRSQGRVERLEQAHAIHVAEEKFRTYVEAAPDALFVEDARGRFLDANPAGLDLLGIDLGTLRASSVADFVPPEDRGLVRRKFEALATVARIDYDRRFLRPDGRLVHAHVRAVKLGPDRVMAYFRDITEQRVMEHRIAVTTRLAALGTLVTGVAHEVNNPMTAITAGLGTVVEDVRQNLEKLSHGEQPSPSTQIEQCRGILEVLGDASEAAARVARIVQDLSIFGAPSRERERLRLKDIVAGAMRWLPSSVHNAATVSVEDLGAPDVKASQGQLEQVLVNLLTNAAKGTRPGAKGTILIRISAGSPGMTRLEVVDHGSGIDPANLTKIFDPFFTTRSSGEGRGTGLGLSLCHAIVADHGGTITVESEVGEGSTFRVELPAATKFITDDR